MTTAAPAAPPSLRTWLLAARPKTLSAAVVPVVVGTGLALGQGMAVVWPALAALAGAVLIQIGTNLTNDYYDFRKGADTHERVGPTRVTQSGLIAPQSVLAAGAACFALAVVVGIFLVARGGWPFVIIGVASVLAGWAYTGGPYPLGYHGLGDLFVMVFFGLVAVPGTFYAQALRLVPAVWPAAVAIGATGTMILAVNNLRDLDTDARAGKRTLVVRFGRGFGRAEYVTLLLLALAMPVVIVAMGWSRWPVLLALLALPLAWPPLSRVLRTTGAALNPALGTTARFQAAFGLLLAIGAWLGHP
ncbi:MAG: 1,4-dihydroxy-2-naphthoate polyprenyltransferase [Myxococcaceae bacterium]|nr:MAG: 1,4-dihydroxy-2-naphthoate polyprenyltransferase [Myxococcaceae bacterium]